MAEGGLKGSHSAEGLDKPDKPGKLSSDLLNKFESDPSLACPQVLPVGRLSAQSFTSSSEEIATSQENLKSKKTSVRIKVPDKNEEHFSPSSGDEDILSDDEVGRDEKKKKRKSKWKWSPFKKMRKLFRRKKSPTRVKSCEELPTAHYRPTYLVSKHEEDDSLRNRAKSEPSLVEAKTKSPLAAIEVYERRNTVDNPVQRTKSDPSKQSLGKLFKNVQTKREDNISEEPTSDERESLADSVSAGLDWSMISSDSGTEAAVSFENLPSASSLEGLQAAHDRIKVAPKHRRPPSRAHTNSASMNIKKKPVKPHRRSKTDPKDLSAETHMETESNEGLRNSRNSDVVNATIFEALEISDEQSKDKVVADIKAKASDILVKVNKSPKLSEKRIENDGGASDELLPEIVREKEGHIQTEREINQEGTEERIKEMDNKSDLINKENEVVQTKPKEVVQTKPKEVVQTKPKEVVQTKPNEVVQTKPKEVVQNKPKEVVQTKPKEVVQTKPKEVVQTTPNEVVQTKPKEVVQTKPNEVVQTKPNEVVQTKPNEVVQTKPNEVVQTKPNEVVQTKPNEVVQTKPKDVVQTKPKEVVQTKPNEVVQTKPNVHIENKEEPKQKEKVLKELNVKKDVDVGRPLLDMSRRCGSLKNFGMKDKSEKSPLRRGFSLNRIEQSDNKLEEKNVDLKLSKLMQSEKPNKSESVHKDSSNDSQNLAEKMSHANVSEVESKVPLHSSLVKGLDADKANTGGKLRENAYEKDKTPGQPAWIELANTRSKRLSHLLDDNKDDQGSLNVDSDSSPAPSTRTDNKGDKSNPPLKDKPKIPTKPVGLTNKKTHPDAVHSRSQTFSSEVEKNVLFRKSFIEEERKETNQDNLSATGRNVQLDKCVVCGRTVYQMEKCKFDSSVLHRQCIKCSVCKRLLTVGNFVIAESKVYCKPHGQAVTVSL